MASEQDVGGIALGLTLDTTGWSSGIARAKAELEGLKRSAAGIEIGVGVQTRGGGRPQAVAAIAGGPAAVGGVPGSVGVGGVVVSPRFQVSAASVRQLRVDINAQLRALSTAGEAVAVPVKLGRVPYATFRSEISAGIGEVPIRFRPDAGSLTAFAAVLSAMTGQTPGRARQAIESAAASRGIPARAQGGPARAGRPHLVGENGPEIHWPASAGTYIAPQRAIGGRVTGQAGQLQKYARELQEWKNNILRHAEKMSPSTAAGPARDWYQIAQAQVLGDLADFGRLKDRRFGLAAAAAASPGQPWPPNRGILRNVLRTGQAPLGTFKEDVPGFGTQQVTAPYSNDPRIRAAEILRSRNLSSLSGPKTVPFFKNLSGEDLEAWVLDARQARIATNNVMKQAPKEGSWQRTILEAAHEAAYPQLRAMWGVKHRSQAQAILWSGYGRGEDLGSDWGMTDSDIVIPRHPGIKVPRVRRYRGGPAFKDIFRGSVDLSLFPRERRLEVGRALYGLGQQFPFTAASIDRIDAVDRREMARLTGDTFNRTAGAAGWRQSQGPGRPRIWLNATMGDSQVESIGGLPKSVAEAAVHEFGHTVDYVHGKWSDDNANKGSLAGYGFPSPYASESPAEHFAELFVRDQRVREMRQRYGSASRHFLSENEEAAEQLFAGIQSADKARFRELPSVGKAPGQMRLPGFLRRLTGRWRGGRAKAYEQTLLNQGGTFGLAGDDPLGRYAVSTTAQQRVIGVDDRAGFARNFREVGRESPYVGTWLHEGQIYIDPVTVRRHKADARRIAEANDQLAIFDLKRKREIPVKRALGGWAEEDEHPLEGFDHPIYRALGTPSRLMFGSFRGSAIEYLMGGGWSRDDASSWVDSEIDQKKDSWRRRTGDLPGQMASLGIGQGGPTPTPPRTLVLSSRSPMADAGPFGRLREEMAAKTRPDHSVDPITHRLPKGVKIRFSREWSDYPDPARFITTGGRQVAPGWHNRWTDPGQLTLGYDNPASSGSPLDRLVSMLDEKSHRPYFDPRGEADPLPKVWGSLGSWLREGMWGEGSPQDARSRAKLVAYALDQQNKVLGHAMVTATKAIPDFGPLAGKSADALHPEYVWTSPDARGKGLASAMYSRLEKITGMPIAPSSSQTPFGRRLWAKPARERAFGRAFAGRSLSDEDEWKIREREIDPRGVDIAGWRSGSLAGPEAYRDFSGAVDPLDRPARPRRVRGQMRLPGFAKGGWATKDFFQQAGSDAFGMWGGRIVGPDAVRAWESQLRETTRGPLFPSDGRYFPIDPRWLPKVKREVGGASEDMGRYIVNEIGRELFVPKRLEKIIPPDVAEQIPGAKGIWNQAIDKQDWVREQWDTDAWLARTKAARNRAGGGGVFEIPGIGPTPWSPPEDGWIVPNRLMHRVPRHAGGSVHQHPHPSASGKTWIDERGRRIPDSEVANATMMWNQRAAASAVNVNTTPSGRARPPAPPPPPELLQARAVLQEQDPILQQLASARARPELDIEGAREAARARIYGSANRGLTGRAAAGGIASFLFGGRGRREAAVEAQLAERQLQNLLPRGVSGVDPGDFLAESLEKAQVGLKATTAALDGLRGVGIKSGADFNVLTKAASLFSEQVADLTPKLEKAGELEQQRAKALARTQGGAGANLLATTGAGIAFSAGMQLAQFGVDATLKALAPALDQIGGFGAKATKVTSDLATSLPQVGTLGALIGQAGVGAGLSGANASFIERTLGGSIYAKAGGNAAGQASDLFRAALGGGGASGLISGYGGLFGSGLFADMMGGGKGFIETIAGDLQAARPQSRLGGRGGALVSGARPAQANEEVAREILGYVNSAIKRGMLAEGERGAGPQLLNVGIGSEEAKRVLESDLDENIKNLARGGAVFADSMGRVLTDTREIEKAAGRAARGLAAPDPEVFARTQAQSLRAQQQAGAARGELERNLLIPGQLGQQVLANPFMSATAGIAKGFEPTLVNLKDIQRLQDDVTANARAAVEAQAQFIDENLGAMQGSQFRGYMTEVSSYGAEIAQLNEQLANRAAHVGLLQYNLQLRILSRNIRDARGLAGMSGGSELGRIQREQWQLNRESQRLQLESQRLANELAQRQINFQIAVAGFQAPGITGQERAARMEEAKVEADYAQKQLDIQKSQTGIAGQQYGLEGRAFAIQTSIAVQDLEAQRGVLIQQRALEQEQIAVQKQIAALTQRQAQVQSKAQSLFTEATSVFDSRLSAASAYVAQFGGTMAAALVAVRRAIDILAGRNTQGAKAQGGKDDVYEKRNAAGFLGLVTTPTNMLMGEAGDETVAILRNPRAASLGNPGGGGAPTIIQISISGNTISSDMDLEQLARRLTSEVEDALSRKASLVLT